MADNEGTNKKRRNENAQMRREEYEAAEQAESQAGSGTMAKASNAVLAKRKIVSVSVRHPCMQLGVIGVADFDQIVLQVRRRKKPATATPAAEPKTVAAPAAPSYRDQVEEFYKKHNPEKLANLDGLLKKVRSFGMHRLFKIKINLAFPVRRKRRNPLAKAES